MQLCGDNVTWPGKRYQTTLILVMILPRHIALGNVTKYKLAFVTIMQRCTIDASRKIVPRINIVFVTLSWARYVIPHRIASALNYGKLFNLTNGVLSTLICIL